MKAIHLAAAAAAIFAGSALAQTAGEADRNADQQQRIEQGLKSGELTPEEAGKLEREQSHIDKDEARAARDGSVSPAEKARITREQNRASRDIAREKHNATTGNPDSASSRRLQADVQRNANQQERITQGEKSGELTPHEASRLEKGQARVEGKEARAASDGTVTAHEQRHIQRAENRQSRKIHRKKHNARETDADKPAGGN